MYIHHAVNCICFSFLPENFVFPGCVFISSSLFSCPAFATYESLIRSPQPPNLCQFSKSLLEHSETSRFSVHFVCLKNALWEPQTFPSLLLLVNSCRLRFFFFLHLHLEVTSALRLSTCIRYKPGVRLLIIQGGIFYTSFDTYVQDR